MVFCLKRAKALVQLDEELVLRNQLFGCVQLGISTVMGHLPISVTQMIHRVSSFAAVVVVHFMNRDPIQPCSNRHTRPPETPESIQSLGEYLGNQIFRVGNTGHPVLNVIEYRIVVALIKVAKGLRIQFRPLDQLSLLFQGVLTLLAQYPAPG
tara:strand:- start:1133 stop:1591 length:459 start_codon:yes stop_codon:yes gene_type:complete